MALPITIHTLNLAEAERVLCIAALEQEPNLSDAARALGITRHALRRRIEKYEIQWPPPRQADGSLILPKLRPPDSSVEPGRRPRYWPTG